jgi:hypothetical protein
MQANIGHCFFTDVHLHLLRYGSHLILFLLELFGQLEGMIALH